MSKGITSRKAGLTIGLDLGDRFTEGRVLSEAGEVVESFRVRTVEPALSRCLSRFPASRVVLEVGTHSPWVSRVVSGLGHETIVANPRRVRLIAENYAKSDGVASLSTASRLNWGVKVLRILVVCLFPDIGHLSGSRRP